MASAFMALFVGAAVLLFFYLTVCYAFWKKRGVRTAEGMVPPFGHMLPVIAGKISIGDLILKLYNKYKDCSMIGLYQLTSPALIVRDPQLVKTVLQSNFSSFHENAGKIDPAVDPLLAGNPFFNYGDVWVTGRKRLTQAFSNAKLKILFMAVQGVCKKFQDYVDRRLKSHNGRYEVEMKELFSKFTGEVVSNSALGIEGHCFDEEEHPMATDVIGKQVFEPNYFNGFLQSIIFIMPVINKVLRFSLLPKHLDRYFRHVVSENVKMRQTESVVRQDFLQMSMDQMQADGQPLDEVALVSHALSFFFDGYETSSVTLSFIGYHLAGHTDVQERLRDEINSTVAKHNGELTFEALKEMTYMDQVINESLRRYPVAGVLMKVCTEEFVLNGSDGISCRVTPGTHIIIPVQGLHNDPKYWENPEDFDPERFNEERKQNIVKMTFLPFGEGPRICVGMRMALLQIKACLSVLLMKYRLEMSSKTRQPVKLSAAGLLAYPIGGFWVHLSKV